MRASQDRLGLCNIWLPGIRRFEQAWGEHLPGNRARVLSIVRYGAPCQFGDIIDGEIDPDLTAESSGPVLRFVRTAAPAGYEMHVIGGGVFTPAQAMGLTERMREAGLHIEVWSLTIRRTAGELNGPAPLAAGVVLPTSSTEWPDPEFLKSLGSRNVAEYALATIDAAGHEFGIKIYAPTLRAAVGDELGELRDRRALDKVRSEP